MVPTNLGRESLTLGNGFEQDCFGWFILYFSLALHPTPSFTPFAIADGNLITGQQQNSGGEAARLLIRMLEAKK